MEETEEDEANYGVLPCREAGSIPWLSTRVLVWMWFPGEQRRNAEKMRREREIWQIQQKLEYRFSITGPLRHLERLVSNGYEFLVPPRWRSDSETKKKQLQFYYIFFSKQWSLHCASMSWVLHVVGHGAEINPLLILFFSPLSGMNSFDLSCYLSLQGQIKSKVCHSSHFCLYGSIITNHNLPQWEL